MTTKQNYNDNEIITAAMLASQINDLSKELFQAKLTAFEAMLREMRHEKEFSPDYHFPTNYDPDYGFPIDYLSRKYGLSTQMILSNARVNLRERSPYYLRKESAFQIALQHNGLSKYHNPLDVSYKTVSKKWVELDECNCIIPGSEKIEKIRIPYIKYVD